jgi:hypothetical protein
VVFPQDTNRAPLEYSLVHPVSERLQLGIEYNYSEENISPIAMYRLIDATEDTPAVMLGTSSAWPSSEVDGNAYTVTLAKMLDEDTSATLGAAYIPDNDDWRMPASLSRRLTETLSASVMYDGDTLHPLLILDQAGASISFILLGGEDPAISVSLFQ